VPHVWPYSANMLRSQAENRANGRSHGEHFSSVVVEAHGAVATLRLTRLHRLNALNDTMLAGIADAARAINRKTEIKAVVLCAEGGDFSSGADLRSHVEGSREERVRSLRASAELGRDAIVAVRQMRPVTLALVQGRAIGGGFVLAAACDIRIATDDAVFWLPEVDLGIPVGWGGVPVLVAELGAALARELILTCRRLEAREAREARFLSQVVTRAEAEETALGLARQIAAKPAGALERSKQQLRDALGDGARGALDAELIVASLAERVADGQLKEWTP
jgi:enoyl-CoA hydratase/carnithine racemase